MIDSDTVAWLRRELRALEAELPAHLPKDAMLTNRFVALAHLVRAVLDASENDEPVRRVSMRIRRPRSRAS